ncbi:hypothetical protein ACJ73_00030 [Blastomyces percursus]|uniref:Uncharacterized protein n=1 Tax=Blastomyces percursus TaxID=1658174 RepID=A0A1J9RLW6_9EURO|nr:hypothetical protein ACJ73_00030 [Blastomyces percursus]
MSEAKDIQQSVESQGSTEETEETVTATREWDIHQAVDVSIANSAAEELRHSSTSYPAQSSGPHFPFRPLEKVSAVENVVNAWMMSRSNIERVRTKFKRNTTIEQTNLLSAWHPIVINPMPQPGTLRGIAPDKKKVAVVTALGKLSHSNGLFLGKTVEMDSGQDVVFGGEEPITFPGSGGGLAILLLLNI